MSVDINGTILISNSTFSVKTAENDTLFEQNAAGIVNMPRTSLGSPLIPLFNVGFNTGAWTNLGGVVIFNAVSGNGYTNVGSCYNTSNGRFTVPWTGLYLVKMHIYSYGNSTTVGWYYHPLFLVNGSSTTRRPGGTPYRIRNYGMYASYGQDSDCCELIYCTAGDYIQVYCPMSGTMQGYGAYSSFSGSYLGN